MAETSETSGLRNLPYFVYGTLRPGNGNFKRYLEGKSFHLRPAKLTGFVMVSLGGFPMAIETGNKKDVIVGELVSLRPKEFASTTKSLDALEGYPSFYDKLIVSAEAEEIMSDNVVKLRDEEAYVYASPEVHAEKYLKTYSKVIGGDWNKRS